jgi:hypothetical protein
MLGPVMGTKEKRITEGKGEEEGVIEESGGDDTTQYICYKMLWIV